MAQPKVCEPEVDFGRPVLDIARDEDVGRSDVLMLHEAERLQFRFQGERPHP
jgi:hypothetical protein